MLDSIREIFEILGIEFESVQFDYEEYFETEELVWAIAGENKCPVISAGESSTESHAMVATGIIETADFEHFIQCKNSHRKDPSQKGISGN